MPETSLHLFRYLERLLDKASELLNADVREADTYHKPADFEKRVFEVLRPVASGERLW